MITNSKIQENIQVQKIFFDKNNKINLYNTFYDSGHRGLDVVNYFLFPTLFKFKILENKNNMSYDEIITLIQEQNFNIICNGMFIFRISLGFFTKLYGIIKNKNKIIIPVDFKMFLSNIMYNLGFAMLTYSIDCDFKKYGLNLELSLKIEFQRTTNISMKYNFFQHIQEQIVHTNGQSLVRIRLHHNFITKGFFINANLDSISNLKMLINGTERFNFDEFFLHTICIKINEELFYVPLDINKKFYDYDESSYYSSINLSRIDNTYFFFNFKNVPARFIIYSLSANTITNYGGTMGLTYSN